MSNSIDVDVNFNLKDINKLFDKMLEGSGNVNIGNIFKDIDELDPMKSSLLKDVSSIEDQVKLADTLNKVGFTAPIMKDVHKMMQDLGLEQDQQSSVIERTQQNLVNMLTISKTLLKMMDDKYPLSDDMQKELDDMNKVLTDQNLTLDDKLDLMVRSVNNIFAPIKESMPEAFKVSPMKSDIDMAELMGDKGRANIDIMRDFAGQAADSLRHLANRARTNVGGRVRLDQELPQLDNLIAIADEVTSNLEEIRVKSSDMSNDMTMNNIDVMQTEGQVAARMLRMPEIVNAIKHLEDITNGILEIFTELTEDFNVEMKNVGVDYAGMVFSAEEQEKKINHAVNILGDVSKDIRSGLKEFKSVERTEIKGISAKLDDDMFIKTIEEVWRQAVENGLVGNTTTTAKDRQLDEMITLVDATFNRLLADYESVMKSPPSRKLLEEAGLGQSIPIPNVLKRARARHEQISDLGTVIFGDKSVGGGSSGLDMAYLQDMFTQIQTQETQTKAHMGTMKSDVKTMMEDIKSIDSVASKTVNITKETNKLISSFSGAINRSANAMDNTQKSLGNTNRAVKKMVDKINEFFPGDDISSDSLDDF